MSWAKLDDRWPRHPKAITAGPLGRDLFVCGLCYCNEHLTDGLIPAAALATLAPGLQAPQKVAEHLIKVRLWERHKGDYRVHDYHEWNPTADQIREKRDAKAERMARWRRNSSASRGASTSASRSPFTTPSRSASRSAAPTPTPTPTPLTPLARSASPNVPEPHPGCTRLANCPQAHQPIRADGLTACLDPEGRPLFTWPTPEAKRRTAAWLPGRYPYGAFRFDCEDRAWRGRCVVGAPPAPYPVEADGQPRRCPEHRP